MSKRKPRIVRVLEALGVDHEPAKKYNDLSESEKSRIKQRYNEMFKQMTDDVYGPELPAQKSPEWLVKKIAREYKNTD